MAKYEVILTQLIEAGGILYGLDTEGQVWELERFYDNTGTAQTVTKKWVRT